MAGGAMTSKRKRKTHLTLLIYVFLMLAGSAIWLKYTLRGDRTGHRHLVRRIASGAALGVELVAIGVAAEEGAVREAGERGGAGRGHRDNFAPIDVDEQQEKSVQLAADRLRAAEFGNSLCNAARLTATFCGPARGVAQTRSPPPYAT